MVHMLRERCRVTYDSVHTIWQHHQLQTLLWLVWTIAVFVVAVWQWYSNHLAHRPLNLIALVIHCTLVGLIGLVVMTWIEMRLEPWQFLDDE